MCPNNTILDPDLIFISQENWDIEDNRDSFLNRLHENLDYIDLFNVSILWSDEFSERMWSDPQMPPWRIDKDWSNVLIPILYRKLEANKKVINCEKNIECEHSFALNCECDIANRLFLKLINKFLEYKEDSLFICLGISNDESKTDIVFTCPKTSNSITPTCIKEPIEWLSLLKIEDKLWPANRTDSATFDSCIKLIYKRNYPNQKILNRYNFSPRFISDISTSDSKTYISSMVAKRLSMTTSEAAKDGQLQDEFITKTKERRFRVKQRPSSTRIHYTIEEGLIIFKRYFPEGHHDDGI